MKIYIYGRRLVSIKRKTCNASLQETAKRKKHQTPAVTGHEIYTKFPKSTLLNCSILCAGRCRSQVPSHRLHTLDFVLFRQDLTRSLLVQPAQIRLPAHSNDAREYVPELSWHIHEAECSDGGPELDAVGHADWESLLQALPSFLEGGARKEGMHAEEVCIEDGGEANLLDDNFGQDGEEFGWVVEVVVEEHEPGV